VLSTIQLPLGAPCSRLPQLPHNSADVEHRQTIPRCDVSFQPPPPSGPSNPTLNHKYSPLQAPQTSPWPYAPVSDEPSRVALQTREDPSARLRRKPQSPRKNPTKIQMYTSPARKCHRSSIAGPLTPNTRRSSNPSIGRKPGAGRATRACTRPWEVAYRVAKTAKPLSAVEASATGGRVRGVTTGRVWTVDSKAVLQETRSARIECAKAAMRRAMSPMVRIIACLYSVQ
jgi:hypothetical protein